MHQPRFIIPILIAVSFAVPVYAAYKLNPLTGDQDYYEASGSIAYIDDLPGDTTNDNLIDSALLDADLASWAAITRSANFDSLTTLSYAQMRTTMGVQAADADLSTLATPGNWKVVYSDGSGVVQTLALGADGTYLKSNGASAAPTFDTPAGSGDMSATSYPNIVDLESLATTGGIVRTANHTWATRTITGTANQISIANGNGVSGNPTISLPSAITFPGSITLGGAMAVGANEIQSTGNIVLQLGDNAGSNKFSIQDSDGNEVYAINSDGGMTSAGSATPGITMTDISAENGTAYFLGASSGAYDIITSLQTDVAGSATTYIELDGVTETVDILKTLTLGSNNLTMTGSIGATGSRVTKGWFADLESTNMPTVGGTAILTSLTAPQFTTIELGHASDTTLARGAAGQPTVEGVDILTTSNTETLTNKTLDANGTGNVVKGYGYLCFTRVKNRGSATGAVGTTETTQLYGVPSFADDVEANNYVDYVAEVPRDWDSSVDPVAYFKFRLGGADTGDHDYIVSMIDIADSATADGTPGDAINLAYTADASGANGDIETATATLTGWGAAATAGSYWLIRVTRDGDDATNDASTVDSYPMSLTIRYGFTQ